MIIIILCIYLFLGLIWSIFLTFCAANEWYRNTLDHHIVSGSLTFPEYLKTQIGGNHIFSLVLEACVILALFFTALFLWPWSLKNNLKQIFKD